MSLIKICIFLTCFISAVQCQNNTPGWEPLPLVGKEASIIKNILKVFIMDISEEFQSYIGSDWYYQWSNFLELQKR